MNKIHLIDPRLLVSSPVCRYLYATGHWKTGLPFKEVFLLLYLLQITQSIINEKLKSPGALKRHKFEMYKSEKRNVGANNVVVMIDV